jgi:hypothetical protein
LRSEKFELSKDVKDSEYSIASLITELNKLHQEKKKVLDDDLAREIEKERLRLVYASQASNFKSLQNDVENNCAMSHFGFTLKEVENFAKELEKLDSQIRQNVKSRKDEYIDTDRQLNALGSKDNAYTSLSLEDLEDSQTSIENALQMRVEKI